MFVCSSVCPSICHVLGNVLDFFRRVLNLLYFHNVLMCIWRGPFKQFTNIKYVGNFGRNVRKTIQKSCIFLDIVSTSGFKSSNIAKTTFRGDGMSKTKFPRIFVFREFSLICGNDFLMRLWLISTLTTSSAKLPSLSHLWDYNVIP